jgi:hypothetical protein
LRAPNSESSAFGSKAAAKVTLVRQLSNVQPEETTPQRKASELLGGVRNITAGKSMTSKRKRPNITRLGT